MYVPATTHYTGFLDLHDLEWGKAGLWAVNTSFSCLSLIGGDHGFEPKWQPFFIDEIEPSDQCHLNGLAMENGSPRYVSAFGQTSTPRGWSENAESSGCLIDVTTATVLADGLPMPHSPRIHRGRLFALLSATGELIEINRQTGEIETLCQLGGFVRGLSFLGDYAFVGLSKFRKKFRTFRNIQITPQAIDCGVAIVHLPSNREVGRMKYDSEVNEIFDVKILPNHRRTLLLGPGSDESECIITSPMCDFWRTPDQEPSEYSEAG